MPEFSYLGTSLKAQSRKLIFLSSPKLILVCFFYIVIHTLVSFLQASSSGLSTAYTQYIEFISAGAFHNPIFFLSLITPSGLFLAFLMWLFGSIINYGFRSYCLNVTRNKQSSLFDILDGFLLVGKIIVLTLLIGVKVLLWSFLLIVPAIVAALRYSQAYYILIDDNSKSPIACIRESKSLMRGNKLDLFLITFSFLGWLFVSGILSFALSFFTQIPLPILALWVKPYMGLTYAQFYDELLNKTSA